MAGNFAIRNEKATTQTTVMLKIVLGQILPNVHFLNVKYFLDTYNVMLLRQLSDYPHNSAHSLTLLIVLALGDPETGKQILVRYPGECTSLLKLNPQ